MNNCAFKRLFGPVGGDNPLFSHWATGLSVYED